MNMGLFGFGKKKDSVKLQACYYGGDLEGFAPDYAATLTLTDTELTIESKKAKATLDRERLLSCENFTDEREYIIMSLIRLDHTVNVRILFQIFL